MKSRDIRKIGLVTLGLMTSCHNRNLSVSEEKIIPYGEIREEIVSNLIEVLLSTDNSTTYTIQNALQQIPIDTTKEVVLKIPMHQFLDQYEVNGRIRNHPLGVSGISKNYNAILGEKVADTILSKYPTNREDLTGKTRYEIGDTISVPLILEETVASFPCSLSQVVSEEGFNLTLKNKKNEYPSDNDFSIVVKKIENGKIAYGLYIYQQLIHTGYLSPGLSGTKTPIGTFIGIPQEYEKNRNLNYRRSIKHEDSPMSFAMPIYHGVYEHQGPTNGRPRSKGCLRNSGLGAMLLDQFYQKTLKEKTALNPELEFYPIWYINTNIYKKN